MYHQYGVPYTYFNSNLADNVSKGEEMALINDIHISHFLRACLKTVSELITLNNTADKQNINFSLPKKGYKPLL